MALEKAWKTQGIFSPTLWSLWLTKLARDGLVRSHSAGLRRSEHITDALASFHWLWAPEHIKFKLAVIVYRALHGTAPQYLSDRLRYVADLPTRRRGWPRSSASSIASCLLLIAGFCHSSSVCSPPSLSDFLLFFSLPDSLLGLLC